MFSDVRLLIIVKAVYCGSGIKTEYLYATNILIMVLSGEQWIIALKEYYIHVIPQLVYAWGFCFSIAGIITRKHEIHLMK